jgi:16S rRNA (guanine527-N7)-methyltransferase
MDEKTIAELAAKEKINAGLFSRQQMRCQLVKGLKELSLTLSEEDVDRALEHAELLMQWNRVYSLSAIRKASDVVPKHLLDSFAISEYVQGNKVLDLGSGAGFPGIPIALAKPQSKITLLDSNSKKIQFVRHVVAILGLENVEVLQQRAENMEKQSKYDTILVRALGSLNAMATLALPLLDPNGYILAMKGRYPSKELEEMRVRCILSIREIVVPCLRSTRHLVVIKHPQK